MPTKEIPGKALGQSLDDPNRLEALISTNLLDPLPEESFDRYTRLAAALLSADVSLVSLVDQRRQFFKSHWGLSGDVATSRETPLTHSFCQHVVRDGQPLRISDARHDARVRDNLAIRDLGVIAYLGVPLRTRDGMILGSFCAINTYPREWSKGDQQSLSDLAAAVMSEVDLRQQTRLLKESVQELLQNEQRREDDLRMLVHDLRTPAGAVSSCLDLVMDGTASFPPEQEQMLSLCREASENLLQMLREILDTDHRSRSGAVPSGVPSPVSRVLRTASNLARPFADEAGITIETIFPAEPVFVPMDAAKIERVLLNLITNAIKFSPQNSTIRVGVDRSGSRTEFFVEDEGPGVPAGERDRIFNQFDRGSTPGMRGERSYGIGLSFCKRVIESHGGQIAVTARAGGGSRFYFSLPSDVATTRSGS